MHSRQFSGLVLLTLFASLRLGAASSFVNFETAPVHPVALSPDGRTLAVCNLADARIMLFDLASSLPVLAAEIAVGMDPVTVRFRHTNELWVVNGISSSLSIVDLSRLTVIATIQTLPGPADLVFAGTPRRAFVSCSRVNKVQVFDPESRLHLATLDIDGERPRALAVSSDAANVYVAILESGNRSTILAPPITQLDIAPEYGPVGD